MLRFFRQIRKQLLIENRLSRYLIYALGEIFLVVCGILIALQVNNWNEQRKEQHIELGVAEEIYVELMENRQYVSKTLDRWRDREVSVLTLSDALESEKLSIGQAQFDSLLFGSINYPNFSLKRNRIDRTLASPDFEFKESNELIIEMMNLSNRYDALKEYFMYNQNTWHNIVQPYLIEHYSFRNINSVFTKTTKDPNVTASLLLSDPIFENLIHNMHGDVTTFNRNLIMCLEEIDNLLKKLENVYPGIIGC